MVSAQKGVIMTKDNDRDKIVSSQIRASIFHIERAKKSGRDEIVVKIYRNYIAARRPGIKGFFTDLFHGRIIMPGQEDGIANELIAHLRKQGHNAFKVVNRKNGSVKVVVSLRSSAH